MTEAEKLRILIFGAHPDDCDSTGGGVAALWSKAGHEVKMVALTNGDAGHQTEGGAALAWRRRKEAAASGAALGCEYITLDNHDGGLTPSMDVRAEVVKIIREFDPDVVTSPRVWDYHPDHRATGQVVMDAMYMSTVPNFVSDAPHLRKMPVGIYVYDHFQRPYPFDPDIVVDISSVLEQKIDALGCHVSQMYEWLPYNRRELHLVPEGEEERRAWLGELYHGRAGRMVEMYKDLIVARYGADRAAQVTAVEAFEGSEYGSPLTEENMGVLFPF